MITTKSLSREWIRIRWVGGLEGVFLPYPLSWCLLETQFSKLSLQ